MCKARFPLSSLLYWPIMVVAILLANNFVFLNTEAYPFIDNTTFSLLALMVLGLIVTYFVIEHKKNKFKPHVVLFPIFLVLTILFISIIWIQEVQTFEGLITSICDISNLDKVKYSFEVVILMATLYATVYFYSRKQVSPKGVLWIAYLVVIVAIFLLVYAIITEKDMIIAVFSDDKTTNTNYTGLQSLFFNENAFAMYLTISLSAIFIINSFKGRVWNYLIAFFIYAGIFFTTSVTAIIASTFIFIAFIFYALGKFIKKKFVLGLIATIAFSIIFVGIIIAFFALYYYEVEWFVKFADFIFNNFFSKDFQTLTNRTDIWKDVWEQLLKIDPLYVAFGRGYGTGNVYLFNLMSSISGKPQFSENIHTTHNFVMEILLRFGVFGLVLYGLGILYFYGCCIYLIVKKKGKIAVPFAIAVTGALIEGIAESNVLFDLNYMGIIQTLLFVLPVINYARVVHKPAIVQDLVENPSISYRFDKRKFTSLVGSFVAAIYLSGIVFFGLLTVCLDGFQANPLFKLGYLIIILFPLVFFLPGTIANMYQTNSKKKYIFFLVLYVLAILIVQGGAYVLNTFVLSSLKTLYKALIFTGINLVFFALAFGLSSIKKYKFKDYLYDLFVPTVRVNLIPFAVATVLTLTFTILGLVFNVVNILYLLLLMGTFLISYLVTFFLQANTYVYSFNYYLNDIMISRNAKLLNI